MGSRKRVSPSKPKASAAKMSKSLKEALVSGTVLAVDPSCGSSSSLPGFAVYSAGELIDSGVIPIDISQDLPGRLRQLHNFICSSMHHLSCDVLVYEDIPPRRYGGGSAHGHASLLKSVGTILGAVDHRHAIGLKPAMWTRHKSVDYVKGDEQDAIEMGRIAIAIARGEITTGLSSRRYTKKSA